jgi:hypothetical protein
VGSCAPDGQGTPPAFLDFRCADSPLGLQPDLWASSLTSGHWMLAGIYEPELLFISSGSKRFGWEVFQFPPGLHKLLRFPKRESPLSSQILHALKCNQESHSTCRQASASAALMVTGATKACAEKPWTSAAADTRPLPCRPSPLILHRRPFQNVFGVRGTKSCHGVTIDHPS